MKVLITGASGFLGRKVSALFAHSYKGEVRCLVRPGTDLKGLREACGDEFDKLHLVTGTLLSQTDCNSIVEGVDLVVHLASGTSGAPAEHFLNSSVATRNLLNAMSVTKPKLIHCSSFSVYGCESLPKGTLINEESGLEPHPELRDIYAQSKIHQEKIVFEMCQRLEIEFACIRPGVIYGPGGGAISSRVGLKLFGRFLHLGRNTTIPITYVENCANVFLVLAKRGVYGCNIYNVVDNDLVTSKEFLKLYSANVEKLRSISIPYPLLFAMSLACEKYHKYSDGQLPDIFTRYKTKSMWKGFRYTNEKIKALGWSQIIPTSEGLRNHFDFLREEDLRKR